MGSHITKQPNGLYALYNTESDTFDQHNLTELDVLALTLLKHIEFGRQDAQEALQKANQFTDRFEEDLGLIEDNETQTLAEIQALRTLMSAPPAEAAGSTLILRRLLATIEDLTQQYEQAREGEDQQEEEQPG